MDRTYQMSRYGRKKNVSFCPMCKTRIERIRGCNHMTCGFCLYEFCWICHRGATADSDHWNEYSLTGCGVGQLDERTSRYDLDKLRSRKCGRIFLFIMCFPFICIVWVPIFLSTIFLDHTDNRLTNWLRVPLCILIFIIGIPLGALAIPFALIYCIYLVFYQCCYLSCCKKSVN